MSTVPWVRMSDGSYMAPDVASFYGEGPLARRQKEQQSRSTPEDWETEGAYRSGPPPVAPKTSAARAVRERALSRRARPGRKP